MDGKGMSEYCASDEVEHYIGKILTQRLERTNGCLRQHTGRWHRRQNKFGKVWELSESHLAFDHHLLQLDLGTFPFRHYSSSTRRPNGRTLELARYCCLSHALLTHDQTKGDILTPNRHPILVTDYSQEDVPLCPEKTSPLRDRGR